MELPQLFRHLAISPFLSLAHATIALLLLACPTFVSAMADSTPKGELQVYFVDVEGGQATLFVTPEKESLLVDTGWPDNQYRDANRIVAAAKAAGLNRIDFVLITHFHTDHVGGVPQLAAKIPMGTFFDHGENRELTDAATVKGWNAYQQLLASGKYQHLTLKPSDILPLHGIDAVVVSADGALIDHPLPGAGEDNPACKDALQYPADQTENARSREFSSLSENCVF
jgi:competence protein ComEC